MALVVSCIGMIIWEESKKNLWGSSVLGNWSFWEDQQKVKMFWFKNQSEVYQKDFLRKLRWCKRRGLCISKLQFKRYSQNVEGQFSVKGGSQLISTEICGACLWIGSVRGWAVGWATLLWRTELAVENNGRTLKCWGLCNKMGDKIQCR